MKILVLCPMEREYHNFYNALSRLFLKHNYKVVQCGVGKANAASAAASELYNSQFDLVAVVGYAAASNLFQQGDFVRPIYARYHDVEVPEGLVPELEKVYELDGVDECTILTGDSFIYKHSVESLIKRFGKQVLFDMESTAIAQVCDEVGVPVTVMKLISDIPQNDNNLQSFEEFVNTHTDFSMFVDALEVI